MSQNRPFPPRLVTNGPIHARLPRCAAALLCGRVGARRSTQVRLVCPSSPAADPVPHCVRGRRRRLRPVGIPPHEVVHIGFRFPEFATYHVLVNPSNPLIRSVLATLLEARDSIFFATTTGADVRAYGAAVPPIHRRSAPCRQSYRSSYAGTRGNDGQMSLGQVQHEGLALAAGQQGELE